MRPHTTDEAARRRRRRRRTGRACSASALGRRLVFAADEYYLLAGRPFPPAEAYEGFPMHEDGVGHGPHVRARVHRARPTSRSGCRAASSPGSTARRPRATERLATPRPARACASPAAAVGAGPRSERAGWRCCRPAGRRSASSPGRYGAQVLAPARRRRSDATTSACIEVANEFFGGNTGVTGLMVGADLRRVLADEPDGHRYLLPDVCLSDGPLPRRHHAGRPAPPGRGRRHRRHRAAAGPRPWSRDADERPRRRRRRRPNVGKSTFVNRAVGKRVAIVEDHPGVTRDRKVIEAEWLGRPFLLVDTGGWLPGGSDLDQKVSRQVEQAVRGADLIVFLVDASVGITEEDDAGGHLAAARRQAGAARHQQGGQQPARGRALAVPVARPG